MFDVITDNIAVIFVLLGIMWALQFGLTYVQMRKYTARLKIIRQAGLTAVGMSGTKYKGRTYGVLTIDNDNRVIYAEKMSGWTTFSNLRPVPDLVGMNIEEILADEADLPVSNKLKLAFQNAAKDLLKARADGIAEKKSIPLVK